MQYKYTVLINATIGLFMALLDSSIVLISLPTIIRELPGTTAFDGVWIIMGYTLINATLLLTFGRLADMFGRVRLYNLGFAIFTVGSGLCSISVNGLSLVLFRLIQGMGGALVFSSNAAIITDAFPVNERGKAIGITQVTGTAGSVFGLVLGGILTATLGWRSIFWINLPVGTFATVWAYKRLKELNPTSSSEKLDYSGNFLFGLGLTVLLVGLTFGSISGWSPVDYVQIGVGVLLIVLFVIVETRVKTPMVDLKLFKIRAFSAGAFSNLLAAIARGAVSLVLVFYFQGVLLLDAFTAGVLLIPFSVAFVTAGPLSGYLSDKHGATLFSTLGLAVTAAGLLWFSILPGGVPYKLFVIPMILVGIGGGLFSAPNLTSIMNSVPVIRRGVAAGMSSLLFNVGYLLSISVAFVIMAGSVPLNVLQEIFAGVTVSGSGLNATVFVGAMHKIFLLMAVVCIIAIIPSISRGAKKQR
jgi:EmrB/QacA subfamily drug resistance transporter